jgi:hypothetical protein
MFNWFQYETKTIKIGYEDFLYILKNPDQYNIISTLSAENQECLIKNTLSIQNENYIFDNYIKEQKFNIKIIIYGSHSSDVSVDKKYKQLTEIGFNNIYIYTGGLFEWLLLQDIYGKNEFPTTSNIIDILKYRPKGILHNALKNL